MDSQFGLSMDSVWTLDLVWTQFGHLVRTLSLYSVWTFDSVQVLILVAQCSAVAVVGPATLLSLHPQISCD